jgi:hypothetical protein
MLRSWPEECASSQHQQDINSWLQHTLNNPAKYTVSTHVMEQHPPKAAAKLPNMHQSTYGLGVLAWANAGTALNMPHCTPHCLCQRSEGSPPDTPAVAA